ncbi:hypothetical protein EDC04DRAFT_2611763 [Pisolithus marmoratus]|nr:hypothetical protein EDC04DRAFT_2611763 [Pisolithus marmoratus]
MWDLQNKVQLCKPSQTQNAQDPVTCTQWLTLKDEGNNILCCGNGLGYLFLWKQNSTLATPEFKETLARWVGTGQEIMAISWCKRNNQLATATYDNVELPTTVPCAVYFHGADVLVFGMYDGEIHTLHGKDGVVLATKTIGRMITYDINPKKGFPKQVIIVEGGTMVVGGGNNGSIYMFDKGTSDIKEKGGDLQPYPFFALVAIVMFVLQMRGKDGAINPLTWKHNPIPTYPIPRGVVHADGKLHSKHKIREGSMGYGEDAREYQ